MAPRWSVVVGLFAVGLFTGAIILATGNFPTGNDKEGDHAGSSAIQLAKPMLPAATGDSPEEVQRKKVPPPHGRPENIPDPSAGAVLEACGKQPKCRQKLDAAQKGQKPSAPLPAATSESPEEMQRKRMLPQRPPQHSPQGSIQPSDPPRFSWLNLLTIKTAHAQTPFSVVLTPTNNALSNSWLLIKGGYHETNGWHALEGYLNIPSYTVSEAKPYLYFFATVPSTGWYIINIRGSRATGRLRHQSNGPIIENWDFTAQPCEPCDYATMEYLQAGSHQLYFWVPSSHLVWIHQVSIRSYP